jgi:sugar O-acyltransferase (sialic acid O-acetyltransferase NeuD family)
MKSRALVIGAGGHARVVGASLRFLGIEIAAYVDPALCARRQAGVKEMIAGAPVIGDAEVVQRFSPQEHDAYIALGDNAERQARFAQLRSEGYEMPALIHPESSLNYGVRIGQASCVCLGARLSAEVRIGAGAIVNTGALVDHESDIGAFAHLAPGVSIAGRVRIGETVFVGVGARIADGLSIGTGAIVGAGSVVLRDVPEGKKVLGVYH